MQAKPDSIYDNWRSQLFDLTRRNPLVHLGERRQGLRCIHPSTADLFFTIGRDGHSLSVYREDASDTEGVNQDDLTTQLQFLMADDINLEPLSTEPTETSARQPRANEIVFKGDARTVIAALTRYRQRARSAMTEQGIEILYLSFGLLEWYESESSDQLFRSPLVLLPVRIERETALSPFQIVPTGEDPFLNPVLVRLLSVSFAIELLYSSDDNDKTWEALLEYLRSQLAGFHRWDIIDENYLGLFSFAKFAMYQDLESHREEFLAHPVIQMLTGLVSDFADDDIYIPSADRLDDETTPKDTFHVLDADASQHEAIEAAKRGRHLVIQGPPGTGKSQTITNIIAEFLASGRSVLFVSEKMAALQVVYKRLEEAKLSKFCMLLHSDDTQRGPIIKSLAEMLDLADESVHDPPPLAFSQILDLRQQLNDYVRAVHNTSNPLGISAYTAHGQVALRHDAPRLTFEVDGIDHLDSQRLAAMELAIQRLVPVGDVLLGARAHPWRYCTINEYTFGLSEDMGSRLSQLADSAHEASRLQGNIRRLWGLPPDDSLDGARWLLGLLPFIQDRRQILEEWLTIPTIEPLVRLGRDQLHIQSAFKARTKLLAERCSLGVLSLDFDTISEHLRIRNGEAAQRIKGEEASEVRVLTQRAELLHSWERMLDAISNIRAISDHISNQIGLPVALTLPELRQQSRLLQQVLSITHPTPSWFDRSLHERLRNLCTEVIDRQSLMRLQSAKFRARFSESVLSAETVDLLSRIETLYSSSLRVFKPGYHRDIKAIRALATDSSEISYRESMDLLDDLRSYHAAHSWLASNEQSIRSELGRGFDGVETDWDRLSASMSLVFSMLDEWHDFPSALRNYLLNDKRDTEVLQELSTRLEVSITEYSAAMTDLLRLIQIPTKTLDQDSSELPFSDIERIAVSDRQLLNRFWTAIDAVRDQCHSDQITPEDALRTIEEAKAVLNLQAALVKQSDDLRSRFGLFFAGVETNWQGVLEGLEWAGVVRSYFPEVVPPTFINSLSTVLPDEKAWASLESCIANVTKLLQDLEPVFSPEGFRSAEVPLHIASLTDISSWAKYLGDSVHQLQEWIDYRNLARDAAAMGLSDFFVAVRRQQIPPSQWQDGFLRQLYSTWLKHLYGSSPALAKFRGHTHEEIIARFRELDREQFEYNSHRIVSSLQKRIPQTKFAPASSEPGRLRRAASMKKRFKPLRTLFTEIPSLLPRLKPCMMMNPLAVARHFGMASIEFDLVVFDEASQILPADAIGAIGRGRQIIVVGDQNQLPPTDFFQAHIDVEEDDDEEIPESVLDFFLVAGTPYKRLRWHYRSRHEELITFSNREFYDSRLITFPSVMADTRPINFVHVNDGVYERGGSRANTIEARRVAESVAEHLRNSPHQSLGVITFSTAQMVAVNAALEVHKRNDPSLETLLAETGHDGFFVKNLEEVQGDERDAIIFSIGYGFDQTGKMSMSFGPLNRQGGERRLNVAVTRARETVTVFASFQPEDIHLDRTRARGVHLLRSYLSFAKVGPIALESVITSEGGDPESPFEEAVATALTRAGLEIVPQVGVGGYRIDIGVRDPDTGHYILGVECDGATYHSSKTARDRDRLRQQVLENLGWTIHRIWSTDWNSDPVGQTQKVVDAFDSAKHKLADVRPRPVPARTSEKSHSHAVPIEALRENQGIRSRPVHDALPLQPLTGIASPYQAAILDVYPSIYGVENATSEHLINMITACVEAESPVHMERVMRGVAAGLYVERVGSKIRGRLLQCIDTAERHGLVVKRGFFLWSPSMIQTPVRGKDSAGNVRKIEEVAPEEIGACIVGVLGYSFSLTRDDLIRAVARELGYLRTGAYVSNAIRSQMRVMLESGVLHDTGSQISIAR